MGELMLASAGNDIRLWDINSGYSLVKQFNPHSRNVCDLAWSLDNSALASLGQEDKVVLTYTNSSSSAYNIAIGENRSCLAFCSSSRYIIAGGKDGTLNVCDLKTNKLRKVYKGHKSAVTSISFNYNDQDIASGSEAGDILLHNTASGTMSSPLRNPRVQAVRRIQYSHFRKSLLGAVSDDGGLNLWDTHRRQHIHSFTDSHKAPATDLSFSPFNQMLVMTVGLDKRIICYDVCNQTAVKTMMAESPLTSIEITPDGATVAVGSTRGKVYIYDLRQAETPVHTLVGHKSSVQALKFQNRRDDSKIERASKSRSGSASRASNRNANLPTPQENTPQTFGDINANDTNTTGVLSDRTNCNSSTQSSAITKPMDADVFSPIRDMSLSPRSGPNSEQKSNTAAATSGKVSLGVSNNTSEELQSSVFSPISGDMSGHSAQAHAMNGSASRLSPVVSGGELRPAANGVSADVAPQQMQADFQQHLNRETSGRLSKDTAVSMPDLKRRSSGERKPQRDKERRSSGSSDSVASDVRPMDTSTATPSVRFQNQGRDLYSTSSSLRATSVPAHMETCGATAAARAPEEVPAVAPFHMELMRNMVEEAMEDLREQMRRDTLSLHVEIIKQFQMQQADFQAMLQRYSVTEDMRAEIERLQEENKRLKQKF